MLKQLHNYCLFLHNQLIVIYYVLEPSVIAYLDIEKNIEIAQHYYFVNHI